MRINVGCGNTRLPGYVNTDWDEKYKPDVVWNLNEAPPESLKEVTEIVCENVLEHCTNPFQTLYYFHDMCVDGGVIKIRVPYYNSVTAAGDLTHKVFFGFTSFDCLNEYRDKKFKIVKITDEPGFVGKFMPRFIRKYLSYYIGNLIRALNVELVVVK